MAIRYRNETCEVCWHHESISGNDRQVECRFHAPQCLHGSGTGWSDQKWSIVHKSDWCSKHSENLDITAQSDWKNWRVKNEG